MNISDLIRELSDLSDRYGDLAVTDWLGNELVVSYDYKTNTVEIF